MTTSFTGAPARIERAMAALPAAYPGPGGAVAVLHKGEVVVRHAWGYANAEQRIAFTPKTLFRICSITKQFTCGVMLDAFPDPSALDADVAARLPRLETAPPRARHLAHNQSGLRDYWAVGMLHGSPAEAPFGDHETHQVIGPTRSLHFIPGTRFSYCNQNFRILSDILEARTGRNFADLLRTRIFDRVGMESAILAADTRAMPDGTEGYEGTQATGFRAAENRILWTGDAGVGASLDDMIAWEKHIDATREDEGSLYRRLSAPVAFEDGAPARYGFGLGRRAEFGRPVTSHSGGLRGWTSHRMNMPSERISVVVLFNHIADSHEAAMDLLAALLGEAKPKPGGVAGAPAPAWFGAYVEPETGLSVRIEAAPDAQARLRYAYPGGTLDLTADGGASRDGIGLRPEADGLWMDRPSDNQSSCLTPLKGEAARDLAGRYHCDELDAEITISDAGGAFYGAFSGFMGQGRMELLEVVGPDVWVLPCLRALDFTPPGDWTLAFARDAGGAITEVKVGCWLARGLVYRKVA